LTKTQLTKLILEESNIDIDFITAHKQWWYQDIKDSNFRLTPKGFKQFKMIAKCYKFDSRINFTYKTFKILAMLRTPYYINANAQFTHNLNEIFIFSEEISTWVTLLGDFDQYLNSLQ